MKRTLTIMFLSSLLLGLMACQINFPDLDADGLPTLASDSLDLIVAPTLTEQSTAEAPTLTATISPSLTPVSIPGLDLSLLVLESRSHTDESSALPGYRIQATYPAFIAPDDPRITQFNQDIEEIITNLKASFRKDAIAIPADPNFGPNQSTLEIQYQVLYLDRGVVSIYFDISLYMSGAAHPNGLSIVYNYDLLQGTRINLADLFLTGSEYLQVLSDYCTTALANSGRLEFPAGALPEDANYKNWNFTPTGLRITFDPYQVGPYAMGFQFVNVPFVELAGVLKYEGVIARVLTP
jgi:hypothetical protein